MTIDLAYEISEMTPDLRMAEGYLACEKIIIQNVRKQLTRGCSDELILKFLQGLSDYYKSRIAELQNMSDCTNYRFAEGFINTLIKMPYWRSWIKTINM
jgi:hypothetical protein